MRRGGWRFLIPEVPFRQIDPRFYRQEVGDPFGEAPGTIVVDTADAICTSSSRAGGRCAMASG